MLLPAILILFIFFFASLMLLFITTCHIEEQFEEKSVNFLFIPKQYSLVYTRWFFSVVICNLSLKTPSCYKDTFSIYDWFACSFSMRHCTRDKSETWIKKLYSKQASRYYNV